MKHKGKERSLNFVNGDKWTDDSHKNKLLCQLEEFRVEKRYTDITIQTKDHQYPVHKNILAASNPFWVSMFESGFKEQSQHTITLKNISSEIFSILLTYIYTGDIQIKAATVRSMYEASDYLQYTFIKERCLNFMLANINHENYSDYMQLSIKYSLDDLMKGVEDFLIGNISKDTYDEYLEFSDTYHLKDVHHAVKQFILNNFEIVCNNDAFCKLPFVIVNELLSSHYLVCKSESSVMKIIVKYLNSNKDLSEEEVHKLVNNLRYGLLDAACTLQLHNLEPFIGSNKLSEINKEMVIFSIDRLKQPFFNSNHFRPRCAPSIFLFGGLSGESTRLKSVTMIDASHKTNLKITKPCKMDILESLAAFSLIPVGNFVFLIGGRSEDKNPTDKVYRYSLVSNEIILLQSMPAPRKLHAAAECNGKIIVVGGINENFVSENRVECYNIAEDNWSTRDNFPRCIAWAAACSGDGVIYLSGGTSEYPSIDSDIYDSVYRYDDAGDVWIREGHLLTNICAHSMCYSNKKLFIAGGLLGGNHHQSSHLMCFDTQHNQTTILQSMPYPGYRFACVALSNMIYVLGGYVKDTILIYDICQDSWIEADLRLPSPVHLLCAAALQ